MDVRKALSTASLCLALGAVLHGQVEWRADTTTLQWGERMTLTAEWLLTIEELTNGVADSTAWPAWSDTTAGGFEILSTSAIDTLAAPEGSFGDVLLRKEWVVTSWDSGWVVLPPVAFGDMATEPILVEVIAPQLDADATPSPPRNIVAFEWTLWEQFLRHKNEWALLALLLLALVAGRWLWRHRPVPEQDQPSEGPIVPARPAHEVALEALHSLLKEERWIRGEAKEVQAQASLVLRRYLEQQFGFKAAERTTSEIQAMLGASSVPMNWHQRLVRALEQADVVKFAKGDLPHLTHKATLESYIEFVEHTSNVDVEPSSPRHDV
jgi:hypothetical protein